MRLRKKKFALSDLALAEVQAFHCGELPRDKEVATFLTTDFPTLVVDSDRALQAWLYRDDANALVGFSSLGKSEWSYPTPTGTRVTVQIIPALAVASGHQGNGYMREILLDVFNEAMAKRDCVSELLGLLVHVDNTRAIDVYKSEGFEDYGNPSNQGGELYQRMISRLPEP